VSSVASDPSLFPPVKPVSPARHGAGQEPDRSGNGDFAKLLDDEPARETAPRAKRSESKSQRRDDTSPADKTSQGDDTLKAKSSKPETADSAEPAPADSTSGDNVKDDETKVAGTGDKPAEEAIEAKAADAVEAVPFNVAVVATPAPAVTAPATVTAPADPVPANALPDTDPATVPAAPQGDVAAAGAVPAAAAPAATIPSSGAADAAAGDTPAAVAPVVPGAVKAQQQAAATANTPSAEAPVAAQAKPGAANPDGIESNQAAAPAEQDVELTARPAPQRAATPGEATTNTATRPQDSAAVAKTGAELAQSLGFTAPAQHAAPAQSTAAAHAAAAGAPAPAPAVPVANVAFEIAAQSLAGKNHFEIRLDPPELGRIDVRLEIDKDGHVKSRLIVERAETLDMLRRDAPQLERALQQAGLKTSDNALEFSLRDQAQHRDDENGNGNNTHRLAIADDSLPAADTLQHSYGRMLGLGNGLDIRV
jgi:flagellar hook-length control protein FliK